MKIAIFGSNSMIAKDFIQNITPVDNELYLFSRQKIDNYLSYDKFLDHHYDLIINFIGGGDPLKVSKSQESIFCGSSYYDEKIISYLNTNLKCKYIHISSGAALSDFSQPADINSTTLINLNDITLGQSVYSLTKINLELRHRLLNHLCIIDLRIFNYVSKSIGTSMSFFISNIMDCIVNNKTLICSPDEIFRDYIGPKDFYSMIQCIREKNFLNAAYDAYTKKSSSNFELLEYLKKRYGLKYRFNEKFKAINPTGIKKHYYSKNYSLESLGYKPNFTSIENVVNEIDLFLNS
jgi:hypothetical protein